VPLLIAAMLGVVRSSHKELQRDRIISLVEIAFSFKQVYPVESIVTPTFTNFEIRSKLSDYLCTLISVIYHFNSVFIFLSLGIRKAFEHFEKYTDVISFGDTVSVGIYFETPGKATSGDQRWIRIYYFIFIGNLILVLSYPAEVFNDKN
jgi:hypothetical protein